MRLTGAGGAIQAGGRQAAALGTWVLTGTAEAWDVAAVATATDPYWLESGAAFRLILHVGTRRWRYLDVQVAVDGTQVAVSGAGRPETY